MQGKNNILKKFCYNFNYDYKIKTILYFYTCKKIFL